MAILPQRPLRGSRISSFYPIKNLPSLASLDSAFQLQEYVSLLIRLDVHDVEAITSLPGKRAGKEKETDIEGEKSDVKDDSEDGDDKGKNEPTVDEACWIYEQLRRLAQDLTHPLITMLQQECTRASCPEMKAGEWLYLCVAHGTDGNVEQCCAIDYILHTLDSATALLNTPRAFPSRIQIPQSSHRHFSSLARRLGRIFAHAYFHHREAFEQAEAESSLYARFLALTSKFDLVPAEFLVIPTHSNTDLDSRESGDRHDARPPRLLAAAVESRTQGERQWAKSISIVPVEQQQQPTKSISPPGMDNGRGSESPRKLGRNRTDTMVLHDAYSVAEELSKTSPKVPILDAMEEPMSPMDAEELPQTAKPVVESLEEIGNSLPESPILHSPPPPSALSLPVEPIHEATEHQEKPPPTEVAPEHLVVISETEPVTTDAPAHEVDIAETAHALTGMEASPSNDAGEAIESVLTVTEDESTEVEHLEELDTEDVKEAEHPKKLDTEVKEETTEIVPVSEADANDASTEAPEVFIEVTPPTAVSEPVVEAEEDTTVPVEAPESETIVEIPDETEEREEREEREVESELGVEVEAKEKEKVEVGDAPAEEKPSTSATESGHAPSES